MDVTLHIIAEGQTEATFVNHTLKPHLARFSLDVHVLVVTTRESPNFTHRGGIGNYTKPERDIRLLLSQHSDMDVRFTTMFDLYQLPNDFPGYAVAASHNDPYRRVQTLEDALAEDIGDSRFFPIFNCTNSRHSCSPIRKNLSLSMTTLLHKLPFRQNFPDSVWQI